MVMVKIRVNIMVRIKATERVRVIYKSNSKDNCQGKYYCKGLDDNQGCGKDYG